MCTYIYIYTHTNTHACAYSYMHIYICVYIYVYIAVHTYTYICIYLYIYTYANIHDVCLYISLSSLHDFFCSVRHDGRSPHTHKEDKVSAQSRSWPHTHSEYVPYSQSLHVVLLYSDVEPLGLHHRDSMPKKSCVIKLRREIVPQSGRWLTPCCRPG